MSTGSDGSVEAQNFTWLLRTFASDTAGVIEAIVVSVDGLLMATSGVAPETEDTDRLAAISSSLLSLAVGVGQCYHMGDPDKILIQLAHGHLIVTAISDDSVLAVLVSEQANLGTVAYEASVLAHRAGVALTPQLVEELKTRYGA
jgi:predicted regulator of Ras-like GTPase activity (Roadblock/LC7/MglB family)